MEATWVYHYINTSYHGGQVYTIDVSDIDTIPLFTRTDCFTHYIRLATVCGLADVRGLLALVSGRQDGCHSGHVDNHLWRTHAVAISRYYAASRLLDGQNKS